MIQSRTWLRFAPHVTGWHIAVQTLGYLGCQKKVSETCLFAAPYPRVTVSSQLHRRIRRFPEYHSTIQRNRQPRRWQQPRFDRPRGVEFVVDGPSTHRNSSCSVPWLISPAPAKSGRHFPSWCHRAENLRSSIVCYGQSSTPRHAARRWHKLSSWRRFPGRCVVPVPVQWGRSQNGSRLAQPMHRAQVQSLVVSLRWGVAICLFNLGV
jgi:hypothetical protein